MPPRSFVLDHHVPAPVLRVHLPEVELLSLTDIDPWLTKDVDDWAILLALHQYKRRDIHGFITADTGMLSLPREVAVLLQTTLSLVVLEEAGHDPISAMGMILLHVPYVAQRWEPRPQLWVIRPPARRPAEPIEKRLEQMARHAKEPLKPFIARHQLDSRQLAAPIRDWYSLQPLPLRSDDLGGRR